MINTLQKPQSPGNKETALILWYNQVTHQDVGVVGGKNASLGEMIQQLKPQGVNVPDGFATTAYAFRNFIAEAGLEEKLRNLFSQMDINDVNSLQKTGKKARSLILNTPFPDSLKIAITEAYEELCERYGDETDVAVRSSATAEDLPEASFAGQQETYLNIHGVSAVLEACHKCFASLFTNRAISYRENKGFDHLAIALSVGVQKMVRSDLASAGVMFSIDTETGFKNAALITAAYGLGENVVQGAVNPDEYLVFKPTLKEGYQPILDKRLGTKSLKMIYDTGGSKQTHNVAVSARDRAQFCLQDDEILQLAHWTVTIEDHYSQLQGKPIPMDIEWAKDGLTGELFIVQARPETVQSQKVGNILQTYELQDHSSILATGRSVGSTIGQGKARVIIEAKNIDRFQPGEVLVTKRTDPDWEPIMKQARAIVTDQGGRTCHAAIIAREMGIPAIVGCGDATKLIQSGQDVTVCCSEGEEGKVYEGLLPFQVQENSLDDLPRTRTQILMNIGNPDQAFSLASIPAAGVGLARLEFIITNHIKAHPLALLYFDQLEDERVQDQINELTRGYDYKPDFFVGQLARGVGMIAAAFYPKPVIVRMSDFKTNEYANLLGGSQFEPQEENPMLGWRGASRYCDPNYREAFALECKALKKVRDEMGLTNVIPMIPFCRTPSQGRNVLAEMAKNGLEQGVNGLEVYVMCELPSNVILADEFSEVFDGFSIGSNDLTQLTLGLDRDSGLVAHLFDERDEAVKRMVKLAIETAQKKGRKIGICGQAPSDYPEFAEFLVEAGIDSMSLNPDSVVQTILNIAEVEKRV